MRTRERRYGYSTISYPPQLAHLVGILHLGCAIMLVVTKPPSHCEESPNRRERFRTNDVRPKGRQREVTGQLTKQSI